MNEVLSMFDCFDFENLRNLYNQLLNEVEASEKVENVYFLYQSGTLCRDFSFDWCIPDDLSRDFLALR